MTVPIYIFGTGGHAREIAVIAEALSHPVVFVARDAGERDRWTFAGDVVLESQVSDLWNAGFAIGIGDNDLRARVAARFGQLRFPTLIHPDASMSVAQRAAIAGRRGTVVFAGVRMTCGTSVGDFCTLNLGSTISHDCEIADFATVAPGANVAGNVRIGRGAWIGMGASVNQGSGARKREIGAGAVIGSGAVVIADCDAASVYVGVPARKIR